MKYDLKEINVDKIDLPVGAVVLGVQCIYGQACIFALIDDSVIRTEKRSFRRVRVGMPTSDDIVNCKYLGTYLVESYGTIWSIFEELPKVEATVEVVHVPVAESFGQIQIDAPLITDVEFNESTPEIKLVPDTVSKVTPPKVTK
jgi:hypothetical protein